MDQIHLRLPPALHDHLRRLAAEQGYKSLNGFLVMLLAGASAFTLADPPPGAPTPPAAQRSNQTLLQQQTIERVRAQR